jgi:hypothetical protein
MSHCVDDLVWHPDKVGVARSGELGYTSVNQHSFLLWYEMSNGQWRGFGTRESEDLPKYKPVQAQISDAYSVDRNEVDIGETNALSGFNRR